MKFQHSIRRFILLLLFGLLLALAPGSSIASQPQADSQIPIVANMGQWPEAVLFKVVGQDYAAWFVTDGLVFALADTPEQTYQVTWSGLEGVPAGQYAHPTSYAYYYGPNEKDWYRDVPVWSRVTWSGWQIEGGASGLSIYGPEPEQLMVTTGNSPSQTELLSILPLQFAPQQTSIVNQPAPTVGYSTFIGAPLWDQADSVAVDSAGNAYTTGYSTSFDFPTLPGEAAGHGVDIFLTKLNAAGTALDYVLHVNPNPQGLDTGQDYGQAISWLPISMVIPSWTLRLPISRAMTSLS